jgi:hypothetical protein
MSLTFSNIIIKFTISLSHIQALVFKLVCIIPDSSYDYIHEYKEVLRMRCLYQFFVCPHTVTLNNRHKFATLLIKGDFSVMLICSRTRNRPIVIISSLQSTAGYRPIQFHAISLDPRLLVSSFCQPFFDWPACVKFHAADDTQFRVSVFYGL